MGTGKGSAGEGTRPCQEQQKEKKVKTWLGHGRFPSRNLGTGTNLKENMVSMGILNRQLKMRNENLRTSQG